MRTSIFVILSLLLFQTANAQAQEPSKSIEPIELFDYFVQLGAFTDKSAALDLVAKSESLGLSTSLSERELMGRTHYRVRMGPYRTRAEADKQAAAVENVVPQPLIVRIERHNTPGTRYASTQQPRAEPLPMRKSNNQLSADGIITKIGIGQSAAEASCSATRGVATGANIGTTVGTIIGVFGGKPPDTSQLEAAVERHSVCVDQNTKRIEADLYALAAHPENCTLLHELVLKSYSRWAKEMIDYRKPLEEPTVLKNSALRTFIVCRQRQ
jgi:SPOR domain